MKRKNKLRNIVRTDFVTLFGPTPWSVSSKLKLKNYRSVFLLGDTLKPASMDAKKSKDITNKDSYRKYIRVLF